MTGTNVADRRWITLLVASAIACSNGESSPKVPLDQLRADSAHAAAGVQAQGGQVELTADARIALDSGNALFRKKAYSAALEQYRLSSSRSPKHAAPYFGIYMVAQATKNASLADSALANIRANNGVPPRPGFDHADTNAMPPAGNKGPVG